MNDTARITVTLLEPVAAGKSLRTDFVQDTYDHLPGTVLRGALAARWINESPDEPDVVASSDQFLDIFEGKGGFGPLHNENTLPVPLSVKKHKYAPEGKCTTLWWDHAFRHGDETTECETCHQSLEYSKGEPAGSIQWRLRTRTELDEQGVAVPSNLFTQNSMDRETRLSGWLHGPAVRALRLADDPIDTLYFGGRTKHQGAAVLQVDTDAEPEPVEQHGTLLVLRLLGPGVFVDHYGFPSLEPDKAELSEQLGVEVIDIPRRWARWCEVEGWHAASGLPKPVERAAQPGSTYLVQCDREADESARQRLMTRGIGLRRREGFGALYSGHRPLDPRAIANSVAHMRTAHDQPATLELLRDRAKRMPTEPVDDTPFRDRLAVNDEYAAGLRTLLDIVDPELFLRVLENLERAS